MVRTPDELLHFALHVAPQMRERKAALTWTYLAHVLSSLQVDLGATGDLGRCAPLRGNETRLLWAAFHAARRHGERVLALRPGRRARVLLFSADEGSTADGVVAGLERMAAALVPGGVLVLEGINDMYDRPHLQEGFHAFMLEERPQARRLQPFLRIGVMLLLSQPAYADAYRGVLFGALPHHAFINDEHRKFLYGGEILIIGGASVPVGTLRALYSREQLPQALALWAEAFGGPEQRR